VKESLFGRTWAEEQLRFVLRYPITLVVIAALCGSTDTAVGSAWLISASFGFKHSVGPIARRAERIVAAIGRCVRDNLAHAKNLSGTSPARSLLGLSSLRIELLIVALKLDVSVMGNR
jgi:hypothetical protein